MSIENLWGELPKIAHMRTPAIILREQAESLKAQTKGLLVGDVKQTQGGPQFFLMFYIVAPTLGGYRFHLLSVEHGLGFYPLVVFHVAVQSGEKGVQCDDEEEFVLELRRILSSDTTRDVIQKLLTHVLSDQRQVG
jgi:hypothetical protein